MKKLIPVSCLASLALSFPAAVTAGDSTAPFCALRFGYRYTEPDKWPERLAAFDAKIDAIDFANAADDVRGYVMDGGEIDLDIWSRDFFHQMVRKMKFTTKEQTC